MIDDKYREYLASKEWANIKLDLIQLRGSKCEKCLKERSYLHVHHMTYERLYNELPEDLVLLCAKCHMKEHGIKQKRGGYKKPTKKKNKSKVLSKGGYKYKKDENGKCAIISNRKRWY